MFLLSKICKVGIPLDVNGFHSAMSVYEKGRQWKKRSLLPDEMCKVDMTLNVISFSAAISACKKGMQ